MKIVAISDMSVDEAREYTGHLVYIMRYKPSGKYYIGHSVDFGTRYVTIQRDNWFRDKYAIEDFEFKFVECVAEDAKDIADHFIDKYDSINDGLNFGYAQTFYTRTKRTKKEIAADQAKSDTESVIENDAEVAEDSKQEPPVIIIRDKGVDLLRSAKRITHDGVRGIFLAIE